MKLTGVTVLDFSQFMAGPMVSAMMVDHGARVIKVEPPGGDPTRKGPKSDPAQEASDSFQTLNRGKRSILLDLKRPAHRDAALRLMRQADVMLESFRPGVADRLGIGYAVASAANPNIVYTSLSAFGQSGDLRDVGAHDTVVQAMAGASSIDMEDRPVNPAISVAGVAAAQFALAGILMGLLAARRGEGGDHLDLAMFDAALAVRGGTTAAALAWNGDPGAFRPGTGLALAETYRTSDDRWLSLGAREPRSAEALLTVLGVAEFLPLAFGPGGAAQAPLRAALAAAFARESLAHWQARLDPTATGAGPVLSYAEALVHPHTASRDMILTDAAGARHLATPIRFTRDPGRPDLSVPSLGQDTEAVLREAGYGDADLTAFSGDE
jgi:crotonobetainyl-CoA:carnitine CoA-transferase CaiB-like acyl-CoA transferase